MPISTSAFAPHAVDLEEPISTADLEKVRANPQITTMTWDGTLKVDSLRRIESELLAHRSGFRLGLHEYRAEPWDVSFLRHLPSLGVLRLATHKNVKQLEVLEHLTSLQGLDLDIWRLPDFSVLQNVVSSLSSLGLGHTKLKSLDLQRLERFRGLKELKIEGHQKGWEYVGGLTNLQKLVCRRLNQPDFSVCSKLVKLTNLEITLGSGKHVNTLPSLVNLNELELCWIRELIDIRSLSACTMLKSLKLDRLAQVRNLPDLSNLRQLGKLELHQLKSLSSLKPIAQATALQEVSIYKLPKLTPNDYLPVLKNPRIKSGSIHPGTLKTRKALSSLAGGCQITIH